MFFGDIKSENFVNEAEHFLFESGNILGVNLNLLILNLKYFKIYFDRK